jgi:hypothetical protein
VLLLGPPDRAHPALADDLDKPVTPHPTRDGTFLRDGSGDAGEGGVGQRVPTDQLSC